MEEPEEVRFQRDKKEWEEHCECYEESPLNIYNLSFIASKLREEVAGDSKAEGAISIFLDSKYWEFVDYCEEHLGSMNEINRLKFKEVLILLAPGLVSTRYMAKAVRLIGRDQKEVKAADMQHIPFCLDMCFHGAVRNGRLGRYALAKMFEDAFYAPCLEPDKDERFKAYDIISATFEGACFDDWPEIYYDLKDIWPNWN
jgi:hypothetical protein